MAAGSVRLPDLTQKITVDTKDLDRAVLAAKRFKSEMDKNLQVDSGNSGKGLDDLAQRLERMAEANEKVRSSNENLGKSFRDQQGDIDGFADSLSGAEAELRKFSTAADEAFKIDTSRFKNDTDKVSEATRKLTTDTEELRRAQTDLSEGFQETRDRAAETDESFRRLETENGKLRQEVTDTQGEVTKLQGALEKLSNEVSRGGASQTEYATRTRAMGSAVKGAATDVESAQARIAAATDKYNDALSKQESATTKVAAADQRNTAAKQTLARVSAEAAKAEADLTAIENRGTASAAEIATATDKATKARRAALKAAQDEATADARLTDAKSKLFLVEGQAEKDRERENAANERAIAAALRATQATEAGNRAIREQENAEAALQRAQSGELSNIYALTNAENRLSKAREDVARRAAQVATAQAQARTAAIQARQAEEALANADDDVAAAKQRVNAAEAAARRTREDATKATREAIDAEQNLHNVETQTAASAEEIEAATTRAAKAREAATRAAANATTAEARLTDATRTHVGAVRDAEKASNDLAKAHHDLETAERGVSAAVGATETVLKLFSTAGSVASSVASGLVGAIKGLAVAGTIAGGIGVLASTVIGLGAAVSSSVPAALALTGAIGGLGVSVLGLAAIFHDNKGIKPAVDELKKSFAGLTQDLQSRVNPSIIAFLKQVEQLAPMIRAQLPAFANAFNEVTTRLTNLLKDSGFQKDLQLIIQSGIKQFQLFGDAGVIAFRGIIGLAAETGPFVEKIGEAAKRVAGEFTAWVAEARRTGEIKILIDNATKSLESLGRIVANLAVGFKNLFEASNAAGFTASVLGALETITKSFRTFTHDRQADLQAMFTNLSGQVRALPPLFDAVANGIRTILTKIDLRPLIQGVIDILPNLAEGLVEAANAAARLGQLAAPSINSVITLVRQLIPYVERIGTAFLTNVKPAIDAVSPGIVRLGAALADIAEHVMPLLGAVARTVGQDFTALVGILAPIAQLVGVVVGSLTGFSTVITNIGIAFIALKVGQSIFSGLGAAIKGTAEPANKLQKAIVGVTDAAKTAATGVRVAAIDMAEAYTETSTKVQGAFTRMGEAVDRSTQGIRAALAGSSTAFQELGTNAEENGHRIVAGFGNAAASVAEGAQRMIGGFGGAVEGAGRLAGAAAGTGRALTSGLGSAVSGVTGALGGPWGVAITAAVLALSEFQSRSEEAKAAEQELQGALEQSNGVIDTHVQQLVQAKLADEYGALAADKLGVSQGQLAEAVAKGGPEYDAYIGQLKGMLEGTNSYIPVVSELLASFGDEQGQLEVNIHTAEQERDAINKATEARRQQAEIVTRNNAQMTTEQRNAQDVAQGFDKITHAAGDSSKAVDGLSQALDGITGHGRDAEKASSDLTQSIESLGQSVNDSDGKIQILGGTLDTTTKAGAEFSQAADEMRTKTLASAEAAFQQAGGMSNVQAATAAATREVQRSRDALIESALRFGATREEAEKYADQLGLIPQTVITAIEADPTKAQQTFEDWKRGVPANPPPPVPVDANVDPAQKTLQSQLYGGILNPPGGPTPAPVGANVAPAQQTIQNDLLAGILAPKGGPPPLPVTANTAPAQAEVDKQKGAIQAPQGGPPALPVGAVTEIAQQIVGEFVKEINAPAGGPPKLPISADVTAGEREALAWVARINGFADAKLPIHANFDQFNVELANRLADIAKAPVPIPLSADFTQFDAQLGARITAISRTPVPVPLSANIDQLNAQYSQAYTFISTNVIAVPLAANIDQLNQQYHDAYVFISTNIVYVPVAGDFSQLINMYLQIVQIMESTPIIVPIYGQFMGIIGGGGGGGGGGQGLMQAADGAVVDYFASGGLSERDKTAMKAMLGDRVTLNASGNVKSLWSAMGLTEMSASQAQVVAPNTWRVVGDRPQGDEAFIPLNNSARSEALLEEAGKRMGFAVQKMAEGGFGNASSTTTGTPSSNGSYVSSSTNNQNDAPLINGDLNVVVPQDTPVQDAMDEVLFQIRRLKRGGVYAANRTRGT